MLQLGIEPHVAIATNMFALTFMSVGGTLPFLGRGALDEKRLPKLLFLTVIGSVCGAGLVLILPSKLLPQLVSIFMLAIALFLVAKRESGLTSGSRAPSPAIESAGYVATFILGIYGGFFSGGYVTLLTATYIALFHMTYLEAIANTKVINFFSSLIATLLFIVHGIVDYQLGIVLGVVMLLGGMLGSRLVLKLSNKWIQRIFLITVIVLACKSLV